LTSAISIYSSKIFLGISLFLLKESPFDFGASYNSFKTKRDEVYRRHEFTSKSDTSSAWLYVYFPKTAGSAYEACLKAYVRDQTGIHISAKDVSEVGATVTIHWRPLPPLEGVALEIKVKEGDREETVSQQNLGPNADMTFIVNRQRNADVNRQRNAEVRIVVNAEGNTDSLLIPEPIAVAGPVPVEALSELGQDQKLMAFCRKYEGIFEIGNSGPGLLEVYEWCGGCGGIPARGGAALQPGEKRTTALNNGETFLIARGAATRYYWKELGRTGDDRPKAVCPQ
jgi:hypothetical protein